MKPAHPDLIAHLQQSVTTLAYLWLIRRLDGRELGFTSFDQDLTIGDVTYKAATGFTPSAVATDLGLSVNNQTLQSVLDDQSITERDLLGGKYDGARVTVMLVNYLDLPYNLAVDPPKHLVLSAGILGEVTQSPQGFAVEARSLAQFLQQKYSEATSKLCRYEFGDARCGVNLAPYSHPATVTTVTNNRIFQITVEEPVPGGLLQYGHARFTSGANRGLRVAIATHNGSTLSLFEPLPFAPEPGDTLTVIQGCDKTIDNGCGRYNNVVNFGGEPSIIGQDEYYRNP